MTTQEGNSVIFYDCERANKAGDHSGKDPSFWPTGIVRKIYKYRDSDVLFVADIERADGTISKSHFVSSLKPTIHKQ